LVCLWSSYESNNGIKYKKRNFQLLLLWLQIIVILCFCVSDLLSFYILFEITLIPMLLIIGGWGLRQRKIHAVLLFVLYTFIGSIFFLLAIILLINQKNNLDIAFLYVFKNYINHSIYDRFIWFFLFIAFCVKIPLFPFHLWLPEAHVEAPTIGSMLLAGILLKLGTYGILRFLFPLNPNALQYFYPIISLFCIIAIIYISFTALCQTDLKKIIAYSSISHMSYVILGMCSISKIALLGSIYLMLAHGFASAGLFYIIGCLYSRYHTRVIFYYGGLITTMPIFSILFFFLILANVSFPGSSNFVSECLILVGLINDNYIIGLIALFFVIITAIYSFWFYNRIVMGQYNLLIYNVSDLNIKEIITLSILSFLVILYGIFPNLLFQYLEYYCYFLIELRLVSTHFLPLPWIPPEYWLSWYTPDNPG